MGNHIKEGIEVTFDGKIKPPTSVDSGLPDAAGLIIFFGVQRRMP